MAVDDAEVDRARQLEVGADPGHEVHLPAVDEVRRGPCRRADSTLTTPSRKVRSMVVLRGRAGGLAEARVAGAERPGAAETAGPRWARRPWNDGQVEVEGDALVVHPQLAALDDQPAQADLRGGAPLPELELRDVVAALGKAWTRIRGPTIRSS